VHPYAIVCNMIDSSLVDSPEIDSCLLANFSKGVSCVIGAALAPVTTRMHTHRCRRREFILKMRRRFAGENNDF
jgi:hypothetical protein